MKLHPVLAILSLLCLAGIPTVAPAQQNNADMQEAMKKWQEAATPGKAHKLLDYFVGNWDLTTRIWMGGPDAKPSEEKSTGTFAWDLGGRFVEQNVTGTIMGRPYTGKGFLGYDNMDRKYTSIWMDNTATAMIYADGCVDQAGKVFTFIGKMDEPTTGEHDKNAKYVTRIVDNDHFVYEIHDLAIGEPNTKVMEIAYTRKK